MSQDQVETKQSISKLSEEVSVWNKHESFKCAIYPVNQLEWKTYFDVQVWTRFAWMSIQQQALSTHNEQNNHVMICSVLWVNQANGLMDLCIIVGCK